MKHAVIFPLQYWFGRKFETVMGIGKISWGKTHGVMPEMAKYHRYPWCFTLLVKYHGGFSTCHTGNFSTKIKSCCTDMFPLYCTLLFEVNRDGYLCVWSFINIIAYRLIQLGFKLLTTVQLKGAGSFFVSGLQRMAQSIREVIAISTNRTWVRSIKPSVLPRVTSRGYMLRPFVNCLDTECCFNHSNVQGCPNLNK